MEAITINVYNIVGNSACIEADDGQKVFVQISLALKAESKVIISFQNIAMLTAAFLNTAIGQVYRDFIEDTIKENLTVIQITKEDKALLKRVIETAKLFYKDPKRIQESIQHSMKK